MSPKSALPLLQLIVGLLSPGHSLPLFPPLLPRPPSSLSSSPLSSLASSPSFSSSSSPLSSSSWSSSTPKLLFPNSSPLPGSSSRGGPVTLSSTSSLLSTSRGVETLGQPGLLQDAGGRPGGTVAGWRDDGTSRPGLPTLRQGMGGRRARHRGLLAARHGTSQSKFLQVLLLLLPRSGGLVSPTSAAALRLEGSSREAPLSTGPRGLPEGRVRSADLPVATLPQDVRPLTAGSPARDLEPVACCRGGRDSPGGESAAAQPESGHLVTAAVISKVPPNHDVPRGIHDLELHVSGGEREQTTGATPAVVRYSSQVVSRLSSNSLVSKDFEPGSDRQTDRDLKLKTNSFSTNFKLTDGASPALAPLFHPQGRTRPASSGVRGHLRPSEGSALRAANVSRGVIGGDEGDKGSERRRRSPFFLDNRIRPWVTFELQLDLSYSHVKVCSRADRHYCLNGGTCVIVIDLGVKTCRCPAGFTGQRCEEITLPFPISLLTNSIYGYE